MRELTRTASAALVLVSLIALAAGPAEARPRPGRAASFSANKNFGLGLIVGSPTGLSGKYFLGADTALDFALGVYRDGYRDRYGDEAIQAHVDFLWHPINLVAARPFHLPLYVGVGGRFLQHDRGDFDDHTHLGVRAPIGIALDFNNVPLDIFFELALVVDFADDDDHGNIDLDGAIGIRFWF